MRINKFYYNEGYDVYIGVISPQTLPVIIYKGKVLKPFLKRSNSKLQYPIVNINGDLQYCHKLVANAVIPKWKYAKLKQQYPNEHIVVDHINGNTLDYSPSNLQYLTNSQNVKKGTGYMKPVSERQAKLLKLNIQ